MAFWSDKMGLLGVLWLKSIALMNGKNIELLVENDRSWKFEWIFKQAITCGNVMACLEM